MRIFFGSRSLLTERDPKEIRTSSEGVPKGSRIQPLGKTMRLQTNDNRYRKEKEENIKGKRGEDYKKKGKRLKEKGEKSKGDLRSLIILVG